MDAEDFSKAPYGSYQEEEDGSVSWKTDLTSGTCDTKDEAMENTERKMLCYPIVGDGKPCVGRVGIPVILFVMT